MKRESIQSRKTKETDISLTLSVGDEQKISIDTGVPFFDHMLNAFFFHGGFSLSLKAIGDIEVEPHHLVEDVGIVLGKAVSEIFSMNKSIVRFSSQLIPMDDALVRAVVDISNRPYLIYKALYPQPYCGTFDVSLVKEFFYAFTVNSGMNLHLEAFYGDNSHHIAEALFKSAGRAVGEALLLRDSKSPLSTKGSL